MVTMCFSLLQGTRGRRSVEVVKNVQDTLGDNYSINYQKNENEAFNQENISPALGLATTAQSTTIDISR